MSRTSHPFNLRVFFRGISVLLFLILTGSSGYTAPTSTSKEIDKAAKAKIQEAYGKLPLYFIRNDGQVDKKVKFYEKGSGHATFFTKEGVYLALGRRLEAEGGRFKAKDKKQKAKSETRNSKPETRSASLVLDSSGGESAEVDNLQLIRLIPLGANKDPEIVAEGQQKGKVNYFIGNAPEKWRADIPTYRAVVYKEIYPGIDMKFYGSNRELEYDIIVSPGADPSTVRLSYEGIESLRVTDEGELEIGLKACPEQSRGSCKILQRKPYIYQEIDGKRVVIEGKFKVKSANPKSPQPHLSSIHREASPESIGKIPNPKFVYGFDLASYDKDHPIIMDPVLVYSTYLGGSDDEHGESIAVDSSGNAYLTGVTWSTDFPIQNPFQPNIASLWPSPDVFVTKISPSGDALVYSTYLGGSSGDNGTGIAVDDSGNVYLTGDTESTDFPIQNPIQPDNAGGFNDAFVTKINPTGDALIYSTYLGGSDRDRGYDIAVDDSGNVYLTGVTWSTDFPTQNPIQPSLSGSLYDVFVTKINQTGDALVYSTYLGGSSAEYGLGIAVDGSGNVYLTGLTTSADFPTQNPLQPDYGGLGDAFLTKISPTGDALVYSTYLGGSDDDRSKGIAVDNSGNAYLAGSTYSIDFPTQNPFQPDHGGGYYDAFVTKISPSGNALVYSTYLGGSDRDWGYDIAVDDSGNVYLTGRTESTDFPTQNPIQPDYGGGDGVRAGDVFVTKINPTGDALVYSTYLGGSDDDSGWGIAVDDSGNVYLTGITYSPDFPGQNPLQPNFGGGYKDAFVTKIWNILPVPDIKANGSDGPVIINEGDLLSVTITLDAGDLAGTPADWYACATSPLGQYHYNYPDRNWTPDCVLAVSSSPLFDLSTFEVLNSDDLLPFILPPGNYTFCFDVDTSVVYSDCVDVTIQ